MATTYKDPWHVFLYQGTPPSSSTENKVKAHFTDGGTGNAPSDTSDFNWPTGVSGGVSALSTHLAWFPFGIQLDRSAGSFKLWLARDYQTYDPDNNNHNLVTVGMTNFGEVAPGVDSLYLIESINTGLNLVRYQWPANPPGFPPTVKTDVSTPELNPSNGCCGWAGVGVHWVPDAGDGKPGYQMWGLPAVNLDNPGNKFDLGQPVKSVTIDPNFVPQVPTQTITPGS